mmetsp:Transcript_20420/g.61012  ORF Transcript_20420/g.61012 Transcript_20420/m.61012 type:complete len:625 (+) Transcript_20420:36-1910(+)
MAEGGDAAVAGEFDPPNSKEDALAFDSEHLLRTENIPFDIDNWYPKLAPFTFATIFLPLSRPEARAIIRYHWKVHMHRSAAAGGGFTMADADVLEALETRIDVAIDGHPSLASEGCFMRLCGRSPKDADPLDRGRIRREYHNALAAMAGDGTDPARLTPEEKMLAAAKVGVMKCRTGADVMSLLLSSERVYSDMLDWLWYGEPEQIVLRQWQPDLSLDFEFRLYVHEGRLTAISQYDHYTRYDHLFPLKEMLQQRMVALWEQIHPCVGVDSYGMDLVYLPASDQLRFLELSPFLRCTGAHCFRWGNPDDVDVLEGRRPFEFRLVEQTAPHFASMFATGWDSRWAEAEDSAPFWVHYQTAFRRPSYEFRRDAARWLRQPGAIASCAATAVGVASVVAAACNVNGTASAGWVLAAGGVTAATASAAALLLALPSVPPITAKPRHLLFVYGTLKRGMHWHSKFLSTGAHFVARATTADRFPLVVGQCGVPYLLFDVKGSGHRVEGELYRVTDDTLDGLDEYEGVGKFYYARPQIRVLPEGAESAVEASVYSMQESPQALRELEHLPSYTLAMHKERYRACEHIQLKQQLYLVGTNQYSRKNVPHRAVSVEVDAGPPRIHHPHLPLLG